MKMILTILGFLLVLPSAVSATDYYVDKDSIGGACSDPGPGTLAQPWCTISKANSALLAGDTVYIRAGTYQEGILPAKSGTDGNYITYTSYSNKPVTITTIGSSFWEGAELTDKSYIIIDGLTFTNTRARMIRMEPSHHCIIRNNNLHGNNQYISYAVSLKDGASYNQILNNTLEMTSNGTVCETTADCTHGIFDLIRVQTNSHHNIIKGNDIGKCLHVALNADGDSKYNIISNNYFHNAWHSNLALYPTRFTVVENNIIAYAGEEYLGNPWLEPISGGRIDHSGIQIGTWSGATTNAENNIVRHNLFYNNGQLSIIWRTQSNYIYHNTDHHSYRFNLYSEPVETVDNVFKNNIFDQNQYFRIYNPVPMDANYFLSNDITSDIYDTGDDIVTIAVLEADYPQKWQNNLMEAPQFINMSANDFTLQPTSLLIDQGDYLTVARSAGSGINLPVEDARYFIDGFGIMEGDAIKLQNGQNAKIVSIDYDTNTLILDGYLSWNTGEGVSLSYSGLAPDIGSYEYQDSSAPGCTEQGFYCCPPGGICLDPRSGSGCDSGETCCSSQEACPPPDTCEGMGFKCCSYCVPGTEYPENDSDCSEQVCCGECGTQQPAENTTYSVKAFVPIVVDGRAEEIWRNTHKVTFSNPSRSDNIAQVSSLFDDISLYFFFNVTDQQLEAANQSYWEDDGAELYIDTGNDKSTGMDSNDYHFIINIYDLTQEPGIQSVTDHNPDGYTMEMSIPWSAVSSQPYFGMVMGILLANNDMDDGGSSQFDWLGLIETGSYSRPSLWGNILLTVRADTSGDGCVRMDELVDFIDSWKYDSTEYPMWEMMEAVVLYYSPGDLCS